MDADSAFPELPALVAILGPTASGKSALGLEIAERLAGEIVCCDSMQVYRGMEIGTAKPTAAERLRCAHHLFDLVNPDRPFHAAAWANLAEAALIDIGARGRLPVVVGGTGLYFRALVSGLFDAPPSDDVIRVRHKSEAEELGVPALHERLRQIDPEAANRILPNDLLRISRALEVFEQTGVPITHLQKSAQRKTPLRIFSIVLDPPIEDLRHRIDARVEGMMAAGLLDEVRRLRAAGFGETRAMQALGYKQLGLHLDGVRSWDEAVLETKRATAAYARRQKVWFRKENATLRPTGLVDVETLVGAIAAWRRDAETVPPL